MKFPIRTLTVAVAAATMVPTFNVLAQEETLTEEVVVIGTRTQGRSALDSPAPVDVIGGETMSNQGGHRHEQPAQKCHPFLQRE